MMKGSTSTSNWGGCSANGSRYIAGDFNAKMGHRRPGGEDILGPYTFGREAQHRVEQLNRDIRVKFCTGGRYVVANTLMRWPSEEKVTFMEVGHLPMGLISEASHTTLDLLLVPQAAHADILGVRSIRKATIATNHFLLCRNLECDCNVGP